MRAFVFNRINGLAGRPAAWTPLRSYSSAAADQPIKPFIMISMGVEAPPLGMPAESRTQEVPFTVWVHNDSASMLRIDDMCNFLKNNLPTEDGFKVGGMSVYNIKWLMTGEDVRDDHFQTNTRPVRFSMMTRR